VELEKLIGTISKQYRKVAQWSYMGDDLSILDAAIRAATSPSDGSQVTITMSTDTSNAMAELEAMLAEQAATTREEIPDASNFAVLKGSTKAKKSTTKGASSSSPRTTSKKKTTRKRTTAKK
jgi:hypothetical protein